MILFFYTSFITATDNQFTFEAGLRDPVGRNQEINILNRDYPNIKAAQIANGSVYNDDHINITVSNDIKADLNSPIVPTQEERVFTKNNVPIVMPYLVRPEQMLLLMKHD